MWRATHHFKKVQIARKHVSNMKICSFLLLKRSLNTHSKQCRHLTMFGIKVPAHINRFGRLQNFSNRNLICKTFYVVSTKSGFFYMVSMYRSLTFLFKCFLFFCDFYHVCANVSKNISKIIISFHFYKEEILM